MKALTIGLALLVTTVSYVVAAENRSDGSGGVTEAILAWADLELAAHMARLRHDATAEHLRADHARHVLAVADFERALHAKQERGAAETRDASAEVVRQILALADQEAELQRMENGIKVATQ